MNLIRKIMIILFLLVAILISGMWIMSALNISYSKKAMSGLRLEQIEDTFYSNLAKIDAHNTLMEKDAEEVATIGEMFYTMKHRDQKDYRMDMEAFLRKKTLYFPEAFGGGIWFEPYVYDKKEEYFAPYAYWKDDDVLVTWDYSTEQYDYHNQEWYRVAIPAEWDVTQKRPEKFYWTPAHYEAMLDAVVITLNALMYDETGKIIGVATVDWGVDDTINLVSDVNVTANSFSFLIDQKNRKLSSLSKEKSLESQTLLTHLSLETFEGYEWTQDYLAGLTKKPKMYTKDIPIEGRDYALFFSKTRSGMIFGISVPKDEIYSIIEHMRRLNYQIVIVTIIILIALSSVILYIVLGIMRLLDTLYTDSLTGLPNRTKLLQDIKNTNYEAIIVINIDDFKQINDFYGHPCGDFVLKEFANRLQSFMALNTHVPKEIVALYKMPSDEYAILTHRKVSETDLEHYLQEISSFANNQIFQFQEQEIALHVTMGVAINTHIGQKTERENEMFSASANMALKLAKEQKQQHLIYQKSLKIREEYERNIIWTQKLREAMAEDRIVPYFQPIVNIANGRIEKFECLVRMIDHDGNIITPLEFLEVAKRLRIYHHITKTVISKSFLAFRNSEYGLSINLSYQDIVNQDVTDFIKEQLLKYGNASQVSFEILESESISNYQQVFEFIREVKEMGCKISIDDFGTGYSNFEHLLKLNVDFIKIDGSLIKNIHQDRTSLILTEGIVSFAKKLNLQTIAEFVHCAEVLTKVQEIGIDYAQGYYLGKPEAR